MSKSKGQFTTEIPTPNKHVKSSTSRFVFIKQHIFFIDDCFIPIKHPTGVGKLIEPFWKQCDRQYVSNALKITASFDLANRFILIRHSKIYLGGYYLWSLQKPQTGKYKGRPIIIGWLDKLV